MVLDDGREAFDPVARVEIMNIPHPLVFRGVDVAADDTVAFFVAGEILEQFLVAIDKTHR